jgi:WD40 repeat protein
MKTGQEICRLKGDTSWIQAIAISPDGQFLAGGSGDTIKLWHLRTGRCLPPLKGHKSWVRTVAFTPDSKILASGSDDATIKLWDVKTRQELCTLTGHTRPVYSIAFSPIGAGTQAALDELAFCARNSKASKDSFAQPFSRTQTGESQQIIASSSDDQTIKLWDLSTGQELCTLTDHTSWIHAIAFTPDGQTLVSGGGDNIINIWQCD